MSVVAFRPDVQRIDAELKGRSAQSHCRRQAVCSVDDEIGISKDGIEVFKFIVATGERLDLDFGIDASDTIGRDIPF
nr:hypothetical protein [Bradyrhizobium barranii]